VYFYFIKFIQGYNRQQTHLFPVSLEASIDADNEVRIIDLFVDSLDIQQFGFKMDFIDNGRPAYHPADLLKLFIYGYLNKIGSSRQLVASSASMVRDHAYNVSEFVFDENKNTYRYPQNKL
jgi:transposase